MNRNYKVIIARLISALLCCFGGGVAQYLLWHQSGEPWYEALFRWSFLWFFYVLLASLAGEHILKMLSKNDNERRAHETTTEHRH